MHKTEAARAVRVMLIEGNLKISLNVTRFRVILRITLLNYFEGYISGRAAGIGCEEHGRLAEDLLSIAM